MKTALEKINIGNISFATTQSFYVYFYFFFRYHEFYNS